VERGRKLLHDPEKRELMKLAQKETLPVNSAQEIVKILEKKVLEAENQKSEMSCEDS